MLFSCHRALISSCEDKGGGQFPHFPSISFFLASTTPEERHNQRRQEISWWGRLDENVGKNNKRGHEHMVEFMFLDRKGRRLAVTEWHSPRGRQAASVRPIPDRADLADEKFIVLIVLCSHSGAGGKCLSGEADAEGDAVSPMGPGGNDPTAGALRDRPFTLG